MKDQYHLNEDQSTTLVLVLVDVGRRDGAANRNKRIGISGGSRRSDIFQDEGLSEADQFYNCPYDRRRTWTKADGTYGDISDLYLLFSSMDLLHRGATHICFIIKVVSAAFFDPAPRHAQRAGA